jgi:hypothetical protein
MHPVHLAVMEKRVAVLSSSGEKATVMSEPRDQVNARRTDAADVWLEERGLIEDLRQRIPRLQETGCSEAVAQIRLNLGVQH